MFQYFSGTELQILMSKYEYSILGQTLDSLEEKIKKQNSFDNTKEFNKYDAEYISEDEGNEMFDSYFERRKRSQNNAIFCPNTVEEVGIDFVGTMKRNVQNLFLREIIYENQISKDIDKNNTPSVFVNDYNPQQTVTAVFSAHIEDCNMYEIKRKINRSPFSKYIIVKENKIEEITNEKKL